MIEHSTIIPHFDMNYCDGNADAAVDGLLVLENRQGGNPEPPVEKVVTTTASSHVQLSVTPKEIENSWYFPVSHRKRFGYVLLSPRSFIFHTEDGIKSRVLPWYRVEDVRVNVSSSVKALVKVIHIDGSSYIFKFGSRLELERFRADVNDRREADPSSGSSNKGKNFQEPGKGKTGVKAAGCNGSWKTMSILKTRRKRVGTPTKLPANFLRIPEKQKKRGRETDPSNHFDLSENASSKPLCEDSPPPHELVQSTIKGAHSKIQALKASINIPSFLVPNEERENGRLSNSQGSPKSAQTLSMFSRFSAPRLSVPTMRIPKVSFPVTVPGVESKASKPSPPRMPPVKMFPHSHQEPSQAAAHVAADTSLREDSQCRLSMPPLGIKSSMAAPSMCTDASDSGASTGRSIVSEMPMTNKKDENVTSKIARSGNGARPGSSRSGFSSFHTSTFEFRTHGTNEEKAKHRSSAKHQQTPETCASIPTIGASLLANDNINKCNNVNTYGMIPSVESRGISLQELQWLVQDMEQVCLAEQWKSVETGKVLQPQEVSMYDLVGHYVFPRTKAHSCSYIEQAFGTHCNAQGLRRPPQWFVSHSWSDSVMDLIHCIKQHAADRHTADPGSAMYWVCAFAVNQHIVGSNVVNFDHFSDNTFLHDPCMTKEVLQVTNGMLIVVDQQQSYFSRSWCLWELLLALEQAKLRAEVCVSCEMEDQYLLDVYSVNQIGIAVGLTRGVAQVDKHRSATVERNRHPNSDATISQEKKIPCHQSEWSKLQALRQSHFHFQSCQAAMEVSIESSLASLAQDTGRIMNCLAQNKKGSNANEPEALAAHPAYNHANALIQGTFAGMLYRHALEESMVGRHNEAGCLSLKNVQATLLSSPITHLEVSFAGCTAFKINQALKFVDSLPPSLQQLDLDYSFLAFKFSDEFSIGLRRLSKSLRTFKLNLSFCSELHNFERLWEELGDLINLQCLALVIQPNKRLTAVDGLATAIGEMPTLRKLHLDFGCFGEHAKLVAMAKSEKTMKNMSSMWAKPSVYTSHAQESTHQFNQVSKLSKLDLGGLHISDASIHNLCCSVLHHNELKSLKLRFLGEFGKKLEGVENVEHLQGVLQQAENRFNLFC